MLRFDWNALRTGDDVLVHDPDTFEMALLPGVVAVVNSRRGQNDVGIRVFARGRTDVVWPARLAVHRVPRDPNERCWRCETVPELAGRRPGASADEPGPGMDDKLTSTRRSA